MEDRYRQLKQKRDRVGLSHDEANELGRLIAEREGKEYANADMLRPHSAREGISVFARAETR
ncbi:MAG TPA: hypothetical protein VEO00_11530 [Actinomycetota bacterium]|nr:hypothetical protein [Actinomycetota bacterium]